MVDAMFERDGMRVHPGPLCTGPWDPSSMHGGPPTVLACRYLAEHGAGDAFHLARLTVELVRPVPLVPLTVEIRETRPGRRIQLLDLVLRDEQNTELVYARGIWLGTVAGLIRFNGSSLYKMHNRETTKGAFLSLSFSQRSFL